MTFNITIVQTKPRVWDIDLDGQHLSWEPTCEEAIAFAHGVAAALFTLKGTRSVYTGCLDMEDEPVNTYDIGNARKGIK